MHSATGWWSVNWLELVFMFIIQYSLFNYFWFLASLDSPNYPRVSTQGDYTYAYNPCSSFKCGNSDSGVRKIEVKIEVKF